MKAVVYNGSHNVQVQDVPDAKIERPTDVLVQVTSTNICGSDLHMYEGRTDLEQGWVIGHESLGEVVETGTGVDRVQVGDRVCIPCAFRASHRQAGCGRCLFTTGSAEF